MAEGSAIKWWAGCWVVLALAFFFGLEAIPRAFDFSITAALICGGIFGAVSIAPLVYVASRP